MINADALYDHAFSPTNVLGRAISLLERYKNAGAEIDRSDWVHLDLGCGFGRIAEPLSASLGIRYVGIDTAEWGVASLVERGFEAHRFEFGPYEKTIEGLRLILKGRRLSSLTMLDTIEHLPDSDAMLRVIRDLIAELNAPAIISAPNVAHRDVGFRLAFGKWEYTRSGLLDHTHSRLFSEQIFDRALQSAGLQVIDSGYVEQVQSDQHFPVTHPALAEGSTLHTFLARLREGVDANAVVNQFLKVVLAGPRTHQHFYVDDDVRGPHGPFLSIVTRTQGRRNHCLVELLTALSGQENTDFELIIVGHKLSIEEQIGVEKLIEDCPRWLREAIKLVRVYDGNRTRPLNRGLEAAQGNYIAFLDDDDVPFGHWVSTFRKLAADAPGRVLRTISARQEVETVTIDGRRGVRAVSAFAPYPKGYDIIQHLESNHSPLMSMAFPRGIFDALNMRFDETITTTEDWDLAMRAVIVVGVASDDSITSVYNWWISNETSSRTDHHRSEWEENYRAICRKIDQMPILLPPGYAARLRFMQSANYRMSEALRQISEGQPASVGSQTGANGDSRARLDRLKEVAKILSSRSWRYTALLRAPRRLRGKKVPRISDCVDMSERELSVLLARLKRSTSWRAAMMFRGREKR